MERTVQNKIQTPISIIQIAIWDWFVPYCNGESNFQWQSNQDLNWLKGTRPKAVNCLVIVLEELIYKGPFESFCRNPGEARSLAVWVLRVPFLLGGSRLYET